jgi:hypothetical protein
LPTALEPLETRLEQMGIDSRVTRAFLLVKPLLDENLAISRFVEQTGRIDLRSSLPEVQTVNEAIILASREFNLMPSQQVKLRGLLLTDW